MRKLKAHKLVDQINDLKAQLKEHQDKCKHPPKYHYQLLGSNTGNYCPQDDIYWADNHCRKCLKTWRTDQKVYCNVVNTLEELYGT